MHVLDRSRYINEFLDCVIEADLEKVIELLEDEEGRFEIFDKQTGTGHIKLVNVDKVEDKELAIKMLTKFQGVHIYHISEKLRDDPEVIEAANVLDEFKYASKRLRTDKKYILEKLDKAVAVDENGNKYYAGDGMGYRFFFAYADESLFLDRDFIIDAMNTMHCIFPLNVVKYKFLDEAGENISSESKDIVRGYFDDDEIAKIAMKYEGAPYHGHSLRLFSDRIRNSKEICMEAVKNTFAFDDVSEERKRDMDIVNAQIKYLQKEIDECEVMLEKYGDDYVYEDDDDYDVEEGLIQSLEYLESCVGNTIALAVESYRKNNIPLPAELEEYEKEYLVKKILEEQETIGNQEEEMNYLSAEDEKVVVE